MFSDLLLVSVVTVRTVLFQTAQHVWRGKAYARTVERRVEDSGGDYSPAKGGANYSLECSVFSVLTLITTKPLRSRIFL